jgi:uncharacterized protein DUF1440
MRQESADVRRDEGPLALHILAGLAGGLVAAWAMERFQQALGRISDDMGGEPGGGGQQHRDPQSEPATYQAADAVAETVTGGPVPQRYKPAAGSIVHYLFGGALGAFYGAAARSNPQIAQWGGVPFGATVWMIADEMGVPIAGLSKPPTEYSAASHASAFLTHVVYGATTDTVRRVILRMAA